MTDETPDTRRDAAVAAIIAAGGVILSTTPLADPSDPATVVAYRIDAGADEPDVMTALAQVRADTQVDLTGLVPYQPPVDPETAAGGGA